GPRPRYAGRAGAALRRRGGEGAVAPRRRSRLHRGPALPVARPLPLADAVVPGGGRAAAGAGAGGGAHAGAVSGSRTAKRGRPAGGAPPGGGWRPLALAAGLLRRPARPG